MQKFRNLSIVYLYFLTVLENPRVSVKDFFSLQNVYGSDDGLRILVNDAFKLGIISRPEIICNVGVSFEFLKPCKNQLKLLKECKNDATVTYAIALCGDYDFVSVRKGASDLKFMDRVCPSFPSNALTDEITFGEGVKEKLPEDRYPHGWDEFDWEVYYLMKDPSISLVNAVRNSKNKGTGLDQKTIKRHFEKILKDCKIQMNFFPRGYSNYEKILFTFQTDYEVGLYKALKKLNRTSFLWKVRDFLVLILFVDHYCLTVRRFKELEENGLIRDLKVSIPNRHYTPFEVDFE